MNLTEYVDKCKERLLGGLHHDLERCATRASQELDTIALRSTLQSLREPSELECFIAGIPGFLGSAMTKSETPHFTPASSALYELLYVNDARLGLRIGHLLKTQVNTPIACVDALWHITCWHNVVDVLEWDQAFGEATFDSLRRLKDSHDPAIALTAHCTAALGARVVLQDLRRMHTQPHAKRLRILELRKALYALVDTDKEILESLSNEELIREGHLWNLAGILTCAVPHLVGVDEARSSVLWNTLDALRSGLDTREAPSAAKDAIIHAWGAWEEASRTWTPARVGFPQQTAGILDRYRSRMECQVALIVQDIRGQSEANDSLSSG
jgi:hypothetical protein